ncbi:nuclear transport factor 2 family protein [Angustibacter luteus]|uniref:Nuclear transport factor 2 family protein n=1 Tax=Angustibacter luteus TaxID=658456 RepID=A0ABW1JC20_9ACTN
MTTITTAAPDVSSLVQGIEGRDGRAVAAWYAPDATLTVVDRNHPPSQPQVFTGTAQIAALLTDVCSREMTHEVRDLVVTPDRLAFTEHCTYADGTKVLCGTVATLSHGLITQQTALQVWDE